MKIKTRKVDVVLGDTLIKKDFEIPEGWSDRAATIVGAKYAMDNENSAIDIINRVVNQIGTWGIEQDYFNDTDDYNNDPNRLPQKFDSEVFEDKLRDILLDQRAAFNSPVWFNCGVPENDNQMSACFIFPVEDNMEDILAHTTREGLVFRSGSGAGVNVSKLRAKGEKLSNKGSASGPVTFMRTWDANAGSIRSGGKTRRSAKMVCMDIDHPDIEEFIHCKGAEEKKAKVLIAGGVDSAEAYATVDFQNTNHSIRVSNDFMAKLRGGKHDLIRRGNGSVAKTVDAHDLLMQAATAAWETGDPGIQYDDAMNKDNPVPSMGKIRSTNPCSEFSAIDNSSCNLASLNLMKYWDSDDEDFDWVTFEEDIKILVTAMDILVDAADYPTPEIREITTATRPLGLGFSNLGALLMERGISYDSPEAREIASDITKYMTQTAYVQSIELAKKLGPYEAFEVDKGNASEIGGRLTGEQFIEHEILKYGLRNSQLTLLAPTGTISFMMDCDSTGIEPLFALKSIKTLAGGGYLEISPNCVKKALAKMETITIGSLGSEATQTEASMRNLSDEQRKVFATANEISWEGHLRMMAACQKHLNGAISKTVNMPADCTPEDIMKVYKTGWDLGLKAIAVYRDGSKGMQPLTEVKEEEEEVKLEAPQEEQWTPVRRKLPDTCYGPRHKFNVGGFKGYIKVSTYQDGTPGELFVIASKNGSTIQGLLDAFATSVSLALQYGVPLEKMIEKFTGTMFQPSGFTMNENIRSCSSVIDYVFKWMKHEFLDEDEEIQVEEPSALPTFKEVILDGPVCSNPMCGGMTQRNGTCFVCTTCGETSGCS